jgi:hypothetical protein
MASIAMMAVFVRNLDGDGGKVVKKASKKQHLVLECCEGVRLNDID